MTKEGFMEKYKDRIFYGNESKINPLALYGIACGEGWIPLIDECAEELCEVDPQEEIKFVQIKEKFGSLRFYIWVDMKDAKELYTKAREIIQKYEMEASTTCEQCNKPSNLQTINGYMYNVCDSCFIELLR
jgi:hypothetical protein